MSSSYRMDENQYNINMIENELMMDFSYSFMTPVKSEPYLPETANGPYLQIIEEPKQRGFRFRYECEGPSHGGLPGASSEKNKKTYPTVKVCNYVGYARVEVQLVTHTDPPRVHAHSLVGKHCNDSGTCSMDVGPTDLTAQFNNLGILHITKRGVFEVLTKRLREERKKLKGPNSHLTDAEEQAIMKEAKELGNKMDLNVVRLKFTAYLQDGDGGFTRALKPAISKPIYDSKSPNASNLKISRMDKTCGSVLGGDEIFLLCDKVQKDDIDIRFFEDKDGGWEDFGDFSPTDVHKQYAIVFKTPKYHTADIERPVTVFLQLKRRKGDDCSEPKQFTYVPHVQDKEEVQRKKKKPLPHSFDPWNGPSGSSAGTGRGPGSFGGSGGGGNGGFHFNQQLDVGSCFGTIGAFMGGGNGMSGSTAAPETPTEQQQASRAQRGGVPLQRQLLHIASTLQNHTTQMARRTARALLDYCSTGDVRLLLAVQRQLYSVQDENGDTPLHLAVIHQQPAVVQQLVHMIITTQQKVFNMRNHLGQTPLHLAVITKQQRVLDFLLKAGADPTLVDSDGRTVVHLAADVGDENVLRILLTHLGEGHANLLNSADYHGLHPLHLAVKKGGERCLRALVAAGADVNAAEHKSGNTALHLAVRENLFKVACMLITELKADMNNCTFSGNTPLHLAASQGSPTLCSMLIAAGARKNMENDEPLFLSSSSSEDEDNEDDVERQGKDEPDVALQRPSQSSERPRNPRKRARGHTPFDLARCEKVRAIVDSRDVAKASEKQEEAKPQMDSETLSKLCGILVQGNVSLRQLAEKLGMLTLADLYQESPSPCQNLLENYQLGGGQLEGLVEALQSLGLNEGVKLLREREPQDKAQSTDANVDSGFGSQVMEDVEEGQIQQPVMANP